MNPEKIGRFICELRKEKNLSQYQLADMIPISRQGVSKWERGVTTPDPQTLIKLSKLFDVSIDELLKGERLEVKSIESLEQTTLSILDENIKKTQKIKRILTISISIITILLLSFLSYYFINSYNSIKVYAVGGKSREFITRTGLFITTKEKYYFRLGKLEYNDDIEIENIKLYYKVGNKKKVIVSDNNIDNILIKDYYGYKEKISNNEIQYIMNNTYLEITYNGGTVDTIKLRYKKDYNNENLFFINQKQGKTKENIISEEELIEETKEESKPEEVKPTINDETESNNVENKQPEKKNEEIKKEEEETKKEEQKPEVQPEPTITTEQIINKIKETCSNTNSNYTCSYNNYNVIIMYDSVVNKISIYNERKYIGDYQINEDAYYCKIENCEETFNLIIKEYLFS